MKEIFEKLDNLFETAGWGGVKYELDVKRALQLVEDAYPGIQLLPGPKPVVEAEKQSAGFASKEPDIRFLLRNEPYNLECKMNTEAFLGSLSFNYVEGEFKPTEESKKKVDPSVIPLIILALKKIEPGFKKWLDFVKDDPAYVANRETDPWSTMVTRDTWVKAVDEHYLEEINTTIPYNETFVTDLYNSKDVYYIQIGGAGLFYLGKDIANLSVPKFSGAVEISCRLGRSSSYIRKSDGLRVVPSQFRVSAKLAAKRGLVSEYTLDKPSSDNKPKGIVQLLKSVGIINEKTKFLKVSHQSKEPVVKEPKNRAALEKPSSNQVIKEPNDKRNI